MDMNCLLLRLFARSVRLVEKPAPVGYLLGIAPFLDGCGNLPIAPSCGDSLSRFSAVPDVYRSKAVCVEGCDAGMEGALLQLPHLNALGARSPLETLTLLRHLEQQLAAVQAA